MAFGASSLLPRKVTAGVMAAALAHVEVGVATLRPSPSFCNRHSVDVQLKTAPLLLGLLFNMVGSKSPPAFVGENSSCNIFDASSKCNDMLHAGVGMPILHPESVDGTPAATVAGEWPQTNATGQGPGDTAGSRDTEVHTVYLDLIVRESRRLGAVGTGSRYLRHHSVVFHESQGGHAFRLTREEPSARAVPLVSSLREAVRSRVCA